MTGGNSWHVVCCVFLKWLDYQPISATSRKTNMEPKNGGWVQMIFLFKRVIFRFQSLVFGGMHLFSVLNHYESLIQKTQDLFRNAGRWLLARCGQDDFGHGFPPIVATCQKMHCVKMMVRRVLSTRTKISHLGKRDNHFQQCPWKWDMSVFQVGVYVLSVSGAPDSKLKPCNLRQTFDKDNIPPAEPAENLRMTWTD